MTPTQRIHAILATHFGLVEVRDDMDLADLGADSLGMMEIVMSLEEEFGIEMPDSAVDDAKTVADLVRIVEGAK